MEWEATIAQVATARFGVMMARRLGFQKVWLEGDALAIVSVVHLTELSYATHFSLISDVITLSEGFEDRCSFSCKMGC